MTAPKPSLRLLLFARVKRAASRYAATGKFRAAPGPMVESFFGGKPCFFVQVGANDGVFRDPLHEAIRANQSWRGIFIEPLKEPFDRLTVNYAGYGNRFTFENVAIEGVCLRRDPVTGAVGDCRFAGPLYLSTRTQDSWSTRAARDFTVSLGATAHYKLVLALIFRRWLVDHGYSVVGCVCF